MKSKRTRHHQVPVFYLRRFAINEQLLIVTRKGIRTKAGVRDAAVQQHFYSYETEEGTRSTDVEAFLSEDVDAPAAPVFDRVVNDGASADDWSILARFMAFQVARSPRFRDLDLQLAESLGPILYALDVVAESFGPNSERLWDDSAAYAIFEAARSSAPAHKPKPGANSSIRVMLRWADQLTESFAGLNWSVAATGAPALIASDNPVVKFDPTSEAGTFSGVAPDDASEIWFPLDPQHLLIGARHRVGPTHFDATRELVCLANAQLCRDCNHAIFQTPGVTPTGDLRLAPNPPTLPNANVRLTHDPRSRRSEVVYPELNDARLADLIARTDLDRRDDPNVSDDDGPTGNNGTQSADSQE
jgi:hypothetical protein